MDLPEGGDIRKLLPKDEQVKWTTCSNHDIKRFSLQEIETITSNYEIMIGQGNFGEVYQGVLQDRSMVAVKRLKHKDEKMNENFAKELLVHSQIDHRNVARLIGYCLEENALIMVTEYISGGNLCDFLHNNNHPINLDTRLRIATDCAEALVYMHTHMYTKVIHGDIKPDNILLDHNLTAKLSDFGISRLVNTDKTLYTQHVIGSIGYMDPSFLRRGRLTTKSDVYSFGVVLLELITRRKAISADREVSLADIFTGSLSKGSRRVRDMFDAEIVEQSNMKILDGIGKLAGECLSQEHDNRPEMTDVAERLRALRRSLHQQREEKLPLYFWRTKNKPATPADKIIPAKNTNATSETQTNPASSKESSSRNLSHQLVRLGSSSATLQLEPGDLFLATVEVLGEGTLWTTYKAKLDGGAMFVMKKMRRGNLLPEKEFRRRVAEVGAVDGDLVLPPRWYYFGDGEEGVLLVYDYVSMGSLSSLLYGAELNWEQRSTIALTVARSLAAIHSAGAASCHGNIKSSNVFLTERYEARLSEHGLFTLLRSSSSNSYLVMPKLCGYHAPEVAGHLRRRSNVFSQKADVYSLGVLLLELVTGRQPWEHPIYHLPGWLQSVPREDRDKMIDILLFMQYKSFGPRQLQQALQLMELAMACCAQEAADRPEITDVVRRIEDINSNTAVSNFRP